MEQCFDAGFLGQTGGKLRQNEFYTNFNKVNRKKLKRQVKKTNHRTM